MTTKGRWVREVGETKRLLPSLTSSWAGRGEKKDGEAGRGHHPTVSFSDEVREDASSASTASESPRTKSSVDGSGDGAKRWTRMLKVGLPVVCLLAAGAVLVAGFASGGEPNLARGFRFPTLSLLNRSFFSSYSGARPPFCVFFFP